MPKKISPCPIIEAVADLRFEPLPPEEAVFGIAYAQLKDSYATVGKLPILQIPEQLRSLDENLRYRPHYQLPRPPFTVQVGPRAVTVSVSQYPGWTAFSEEILNVMRSLMSANLIKSYVRLGLRYINLFDVNVLTVSTLSVALGSRTLVAENVFVRTELPAGKDASVTLQVANQARIGTGDTARTGSVIDIDAFTRDLTEWSGDVDTFSVLLSQLHDSVKEIFFSVIDEKFVRDNLNPVY